jgi:hypothetical protein
MCGAAGIALAGPHDNAAAVVAIHMTAKGKNIGCLPTQSNPTQNTLLKAPASYVVSYANNLGSGVGTTPVAPVFAWLMIANADSSAGIAGVSCGIDWAMLHGAPGASMLLSWNRCADLEFPSGAWPAPGGGNRITWAPQTNCQRQQPSGGRVTACVGFFYLQAYYNYIIDNAYVRVTLNYNVPVPELAVADCAAIETQLPETAAGWAGINATGGCPSPDCMVPGCNPYNGPCQPPVPVRETSWGRIKNQFGGE